MLLPGPVYVITNMNKAARRGFKAVKINASRVLLNLGRLYFRCYGSTSSCLRVAASAKAGTTSG